MVQVDLNIDVLISRLPIDRYVKIWLSGFSLLAKRVQPPRPSL